LRTIFALYSNRNALSDDHIIASISNSPTSLFVYEFPGESMRCYFMRDGHIDSVKVLTATDDVARIAEALELYEASGMESGATGFEVWEGTRLIYRFPEKPA
jgi:hypothetical protein